MYHIINIMDDITMQLYSLYGVDDNDEELRVSRRRFHSDRDVSKSCSNEEPQISEEVKTEVEDGEIIFEEI